MGEEVQRNRAVSLTMADERALLEHRNVSERRMEINRFDIDGAVRQWSIYTVNEMSGGLRGSDKGQ